MFPNREDTAKGKRYKSWGASSPIFQLAALQASFAQLHQFSEINLKKSDGNPKKIRKKSKKIMNKSKSFQVQNKQTNSKKNAKNHRKVQKVSLRNPFFPENLKVSGKKYFFLLQKSNVFSSKNPNFFLLKSNIFHKSFPIFLKFCLFV